MESTNHGEAISRDPAVRAQEYMERHRLPELFEAMTRSLIYEKPKNPRAFLVQRLFNYQQADRLDPFFSDADLGILFGMFDITNKGVISDAQCNKAFGALGCEWAEVKSEELGGPETKVVGREEFVEFGRKVLDKTISA
eukprot:TRINITY_DN21568_c0_g1_i1.p1 TRINITY_DN21568_c0_g1~~TRINITY_DN21568_c0_g1_i1.p1  ORF type:complete len:139 (-),score=16.55 TRINITY_DN21568_c0_g1_i1:21-437(-)